jgi:hypothetical protein
MLNPTHGYLIGTRVGRRKDLLPTKRVTVIFQPFGTDSAPSVQTPFLLVMGSLGRPKSFPLTRFIVRSRGETESFLKWMQPGGP